MILKSNQKILTLNSAFYWHVLAFCFMRAFVLFPQSLSSSQLPVVERNKGRSFFFHTGENASREKVISIHFITYLWAEVVSLLNSTQNYNKSFVIHWETRFSFILIASGNTEKIQKQDFWFVCLYLIGTLQVLHVSCVKEIYNVSWRILFSKGRNRDISQNNFLTGLVYLFQLFFELKKRALLIEWASGDLYRAE